MLFVGACSWRLGKASSKYIRRQDSFRKREPPDHALSVFIISGVDLPQKTIAKEEAAPLS